MLAFGVIELLRQPVPAEPLGKDLGHRPPSVIRASRNLPGHLYPGRSHATLKRDYQFFMPTRCPELLNIHPFRWRQLGPPELARTRPETGSGRIHQQRKLDPAAVLLLLRGCEADDG
jgi:hypothetical protein